MKKKKLLSLWIASVMICSSIFIGCGQKTTKEVADVKEATATEETETVITQDADSDVPQIEG